MVKSPIFLCLFLGVTSLTASGKKPNFVIVLADDVSWDAFGATGSAHARTPHIDKLAKESLTMERFYCSVSQCAPVRAELYTGLLPRHNGILGNSRIVKIPGVLNMGDHLRPLGYRVGLAGKVHFGLGSKPLDAISGFPSNCNGSEGKHSMDGVRTYIQKAQAAEAPFCVIIASIHSHHPWDLGGSSRFPLDKIQLPPHYLDTPKAREALAKHAAEVEEFDRQVGDTRALIEDLQLENETILVVLSEQGTAMPRGKWTPYEYGSRALCVAHYPGKIRPRKTAALAMYCDILPTFLDFADGKPAKPLDGTSLKPLWTGASDKHREAVHISNVHPFWQQAIVKDRYKLIWTGSPEEEHIASQFNAKQKFFSQPWKEWNRLAKRDAGAAAVVQRVLHPRRYELYDVQADPYELENLADKVELKEVKTELLADLKQLMLTVGEPLEAVLPSPTP
ncbi:sulfatase-like hydrolase/transferase [Haloferula sp.]|uniref:sulfatase-like hydrolase/transferase n=1 Tax=Haloferula sp. TaxID=2497595 RepID=UPI003C793BD9